MLSCCHSAVESHRNATDVIRVMVGENLAMNNTATYVNTIMGTYVDNSTNVNNSGLNGFNTTHGLIANSYDNTSGVMDYNVTTPNIPQPGIYYNLNGTEDGVVKYNGSLDTQWSNITGIDVREYYSQKEIAPPQPTPDTDVHALVYVTAVVLFYAGVLLTILALQLCRRTKETLEDDHYATLINREEIYRRDMKIRKKFNILKMTGIHNAHLLDLIPEHKV